jgi:sulfoxide reductase heme-binding subunit YedZ
VNGPTLWYLNRGSGIVLLVVLTVSLCLGVLSTTRAGGRWWPRFLTQGLHRNLSLLSLALVLAHATTAVVDTYVDIRWWQVVVPFGATYQPLWLELGALAFDLMLAVAATSLLRTRLRPRVWRTLHLLSYPVFAIGVAHGTGIGTDSMEPWSLAVTISCVLCVLLATSARLANVARGASPEPAPAPAVRSAVPR